MMAADPADHETIISSLLANNTSDQQFPRMPVRPSATNLACCCGRQHCAYLLHNNAALEHLERNIHTAAQLGQIIMATDSMEFEMTSPASKRQSMLLNKRNSMRLDKNDNGQGLTFALQALLARHEAYMAEAEKTREDMGARVEKLELEKKDIEIENTRVIEENRGLLDQLEDLNSTITNSEAHVKSLEATLHSTQQEIRRLESLASRTYELESRLAALELDQSSLQRTVTKTESDERIAVQRWKKAERGLNEVQDQLERIERESKEDREKHHEVVERLQRQHAVERALESPAVRMNGAAAPTQEKSNVVSHFVKDILEDNANLQLGIVELREMLMNSNEEVAQLREQLMLHQPALMHESEDGPPTLRAELAPKEPQAITQELHIHHHYHATPREKAVKPKKKRMAISPGTFTPNHGRMRSIASNATTITQPSPISMNRWSVHSALTVSEFAPSSAPSSPQSNYRSSGVFDRAYLDAMDSSRPTSPGSSVDPMSPMFPGYHRKRDSTYSFRPPSTFNLDHVIHEDAAEDYHSMHQARNYSIPPSRDELEEDLDTEDTPYTVPGDAMYNPDPFSPTLRRSTSHESILSISGLDIHTLKSRPNQMRLAKANMLMNPRGRSNAASSLATSYVSTQPVTSSSTFVARPTLSRQGHDSSSYLRSSMGLGERPVSRSSNDSTETIPAPTRKAGGWVWSRWGAAPTAPSLSPARSLARPQNAPTRLGHRAVTTGALPTMKVLEPDPLRVFMGGRPPGINQQGPVPGIWKNERAPSKIVPDRVDTDALKEVLSSLE